MQRFLVVVGFLLFCTGVIGLDITARYFLPFPINHVHITLLLLFWLGLVSNNQRILWSAAYISFIVSAFTSHYFAVEFTAEVAAVGVVRYLAFALFTNRSVAIVSLLSFFGALVYWGGIMFISALVMPDGRVEYFTVTFAAAAVVASLVTGVVGGAGYAFITGIFRGFNPKYIA